MQFTKQAISEITVPNNVPFLPGFDVVGIGVDVPQELIDFGITAAIVFYNAQWNAASTTPKTKFHFIATQSDVDFGALILGYGYCNNPSVSQVATVSVSVQIGSDETTLPGHALTFINFYNTLNNIGMSYQETVTHSASFYGYDNSGSEIWSLP